MKMIKREVLELLYKINLCIKNDYSHDIHIPFLRNQFINLIDGLRNSKFNYIKDFINDLLIESKDLLTNPDHKFWIFPASTIHHHNYKNGLLIHTTEVLINCSTSTNYDFMDIENENIAKLYTAALFHDYYKIKEYYFNDKYQKYCYSQKEPIHIKMMYEFALKYDKELADLFGSHHGKIEYGSTKEPETILEKILHTSDYLSSLKIK